MAVTIAAGTLWSTPASAIGGEPPANSAYTFVTKIDIGVAGEQGGRSCTGALVAPSWVITAKACFSVNGQQVAAGSPAKPTKATIARPDLSKTTTGHTISVVSVAPHPDRDVVLAKLAAPVTDVAPVRLAGTMPVAGDVLRVAGYGRTATEWVPNQLRTSPFTVTTTDGPIIGIAGTDNSQVGPCKGDAGGPGLRETNGTVELVAITHAGGQGGCLDEDPNAARGGTQTRLNDLGEWLLRSVGTPAELPGMAKWEGGDFNSDGIDDLLGVESSTGKLWLYPGTPASGVFGQQVLLGLRGWNSMDELTGGDYNGDGNDDLIAVQNSTGKSFLYLGPNPGGGGSELGSGGWNGMNLLTGGDYNGDGKDDLVTAEEATGKLFLYLGPRPGAGRSRIEVGHGGWNGINKLTGGEFNGDQHDDLLAVDNAAGKLWLYPGPQPGNDRVELGNGGWNAMSVLATGDFNHDGKDDLIARVATTGKLWLYLGPRPGVSAARTEVKTLD